MSCPNCGAQTAEEAVRCPSCGTRLTTDASSSPVAPWGAGGTSGGSWGDLAPAQPGGRQVYGSYPSSGWSDHPVSAAGPLAGWWIRVGGAVIDSIILVVVIVIVLLASSIGVAYAVGAIVGLLYTVGLLVTKGQTVGMRAVGTRCIREGTNANLSVGRALGRYLLAGLLGVTIVGYLLDNLWPIWDSKNQTLHDKAVGSLVVLTH